MNKGIHLKLFSIDVTEAIAKDDIENIIYLLSDKSYSILTLCEKEKEILKNLSHHLSNYGIGEKILNFLVFDYAINQKNINSSTDTYLKKRIESMLFTKSLNKELSDNQYENPQNKKLKI
jgi:hypothetical protein